MEPVPPQLLELVRSAERVVVLTGAGMSAESGVPTFRDAHSGLWEQFDPAELATPEAFRRDPALVWAWYVWRVGLVRAVAPNAGHEALARWQQRSHVDIVTQNVDDLHERAGASVLAHLHGSLFAFRCTGHGHPYRLAAQDVPATPVERLEPPRCARCGSRIRPGVVWFGEALPADALADAERAVLAADLVLVVGTSGIVYPAAALPLLAARAGIVVAELNPARTELSDAVTVSWRTTAATGLPILEAHITQMSGERG